MIRFGAGVGLDVAAYQEVTCPYRGSPTPATFQHKKRHEELQWKAASQIKNM